MLSLLLISLSILSFTPLTHAHTLYLAAHYLGSSIVTSADLVSCHIYPIAGWHTFIRSLSSHYHLFKYVHAAVTLLRFIGFIISSNIGLSKVISEHRQCLDSMWGFKLLLLKEDAPLSQKSPCNTGNGFIQQYLSFWILVYQEQSLIEWWKKTDLLVAYFLFLANNSTFPCELHCHPLYINGKAGSGVYVRISL